MTKLKLDPDTPLREASQHVFDRLKEGVQCPCCDQFCKLYKRKLNSQMAMWLMWLVVEYENDVGWVDIRRSPVRGGDYAKLVHWGLIEQMPKPVGDTTRRTSGHWRPTAKGIAFVHLRVTVPEKVHLYANNVVGFSEKHCDIRDALGKKFNYYELMAA